MAYSGSLQRVDFSEEGDEKGFCVVDIDPAAPQGQRLTEFSFQLVNARRFLTVDVTVSPGEPDPTAAVLRAIARHDVAGAVVRVRIKLTAEADSLLREGEIREALQSAHYIAAVSREVEGARRTRLSSGESEGLQPLQALRLYLDGRDTSPQRKDKVLSYAEEVDRGGGFGGTDPNPNSACNCPVPLRLST